MLLNILKRYIVLLDRCYSDTIKMYLHVFKGRSNVEKNNINALIYTIKILFHATVTLLLFV
jgi:hypothetical protein